AKQVVGERAVFVSGMRVELVATVKVAGPVAVIHVDEGVAGCDSVTERIAGVHVQGRLADLDVPVVVNVRVLRIEQLDPDRIVGPGESGRVQAEQGKGGEGEAA